MQALIGRPSCISFTVQAIFRTLLQATAQSPRSNPNQITRYKETPKEQTEPKAHEGQTYKYNDMLAQFRDQSTGKSTTAAVPRKKEIKSDYESDSRAGRMRDKARRQRSVENLDKLDEISRRKSSSKSRARSSSGKRASSSSRRHRRDSSSSSGRSSIRRSERSRGRSRSRRRSSSSEESRRRSSARRGRSRSRRRSSSSDRSRRKSRSRRRRSVSSRPSRRRSNDTRRSRSEERSAVSYYR